LAQEHCAPSLERLRPIVVRLVPRSVHRMGAAAAPTVAFAAAAAAGGGTGSAPPRPSAVPAAMHRVAGVGSAAARASAATRVAAARSGGAKPSAAGGNARADFLRTAAAAAGAAALSASALTSPLRVGQRLRSTAATAARKRCWVRCSSTATRASGGLGSDGRFQGEFVATQDPPYLKERAATWDRLWAEHQEELAAKQHGPIKITLPDGSVRDGVAWLTTPLEIAESISKRLASDCVVALVEYTDPSQVSCGACVAADGEDDEEDDEEASTEQLWDLSRPLEGDCKLELVKFDDPRGRDTFWHSSSHVMGAALEQKYGGLLTIGPAVDGGFYYDMFLGDKRLSEADFPEIEKEVEELKRGDAPFQRLVITREQALELFAGNPFKVDLISRKVAPGAKTTAYRCGDLIDLCRGPHLPSTGRVKAFSVMKNSSAYWLGSADNDSLQRIYGVSFPSAKELKQHKRRLEEAKERDHRRIGKQQDLFFFDGMVSPGSCFWTNHGTRIYNRLQELMRAEYRKRGFDEVITPNIYSAELFKKSGHYQNYKDDMYGFQVEGQEWFLKPMNCPGHCVMFDSKPRSYRELPIRMSSFGVLHRNELSGTLSGLTRVRRFQQDDAHIFCREDQIRDEVSAALDFVFDIYDLFGFEFSLSLSTRPKKALGSEELWARAEDQLKQALDESGRKWTVNKGDGAFYGPKIDIQLKDALGRGHQCGTVQLDFQLPLRFNLRYKTESDSQAAEDEAASSGSAVDEADAGGSKPLPEGFARPVILHRAILGSVERMTGVLCEHFAGKWPFWLSPRQCMVVPVSEDAFEYAKYVRDALHSRGLHAEANLGDGTLNKKVREAQVGQWNYIMVVGKQEEEKLSVNLRARGEKKPLGERDLSELIEQLESENCPKALARPKVLSPFVRSAASTTAEPPTLAPSEEAASGSADSGNSAKAGEGAAEKEHVMS